MTTRLPNFFAAALLGMVAANVACADQAANKPEASVGAITVARIDAPEKFEIENRGGPLDLLALPGYLASKNIKANRRADIKEQLAESKFNVEQELAQALAEALKGDGIEVSGGESLRYLKDDPSAIDYKGSTEAKDRILVVQIPNLGLYSGRFSKRFAPRLNISFELIDKKTESDLFSKWFYYGADAKKDSDDQVTAQPQYAFSSYGEAVERKADLIAAFREGIAKISRLAASQIREVVGKK
jgi:hypothetical protein